MSEPFFHEIDDAEWERLKAEKLTWGDIIARYRAPQWCSEGQDALAGMVGCNSLVGRMVTGEEYCKDCELYRADAHNPRRFPAFDITPSADKK